MGGRPSEKEDVVRMCCPDTSGEEIGVRKCPRGGESEKRKELKKGEKRKVLEVGVLSGAYSRSLGNAKRKIARKTLATTSRERRLRARFTRNLKLSSSTKRNRSDSHRGTSIGQEKRGG